MSFKGVIETHCPNGCDPFETEVWSFINGNDSPELRDAVAARECNLLLCPGCGEAFFAPASYVYFEPDAELLAFVFPESYRDRESHWRKKMREDHVALRRVLGSKLPLGLEPEIFFGPDGLADLLRDEDYRRDERDVMEFVAQELHLALYRVSPGFARRHGVPASLPYVPVPGRPPTLSDVKDGLKRLLTANDRLEAYRRYLDGLKPQAELPPARR